MRHRFYHPNGLSRGPTILDGTEAHHLTHVLRARVGDLVDLFDGAGSEGEARVVELQRRQVRLELLTVRSVERESRYRLTIAVALPKGPRQGWLVEKLVELGVDRIVPLRTTRGVAQPDDNALNRLQRTVIESCKQSGRNRLMTFDRPMRLAELAQAIDPATARWLAHPTTTASQWSHDAPSEPSQQSVDWTLGPGTNGAACVAIGPEGGFTDDEVRDAVDAGWQVVSLGPRLLRIETAAVACAAHWCLLHEGRAWITDSRT